MAHYTPAELELYRHGQMSVLGRIACAAHLKTCPACAKILAELEQDDQFLEQLKQSVEAYRELTDQ